MNFVIKEKRSVVVFLYLLAIYGAYSVKMLSYTMFTLMILLSSLYVIFLFLTRNVNYKNIAMCIMIGLSVFFFSFYIYGL
ncbi:hypothetical protein DSC47_16305 [Elizabethkingia miricola]|nr:hypothetical protein CQS02_12695 [Elizabethkingia miricola]OPC27431.1 hypothetical protein BAY00_00240 [Elizabethkingia bruuniana]OPC52602.1 hypothetical protein BAY07_13430 [Elizabethkingia bruuniana]OPC60255.1 hypothetical protein BAY13_07625 [Elizabethkingia bruuniana]RBI89634.1 hypothetical protein DSC47_16305 [Elizabethkingia miricola]